MRDSIETYYADLQRRDKDEWRAHWDACEALDPAFSALRIRRSQVFFLPPQGGKLALSALRTEEEALLKRYNLPKEYLQLAYRCPRCQDTGYVGEPLKRKCACRLKLEQQFLAESARINERETFEAFSEDIYPDELARQSGRQIKAFCEKYAQTLPAPKIPQLYLFGQAGLGKSFMGNAIAARAIEQGIDSLRLTAYRMSDEVLSGFSTNTSPLGRYTRVPLLVVDDLGTEPMIPNVTAETLFAIADQRNSARMATVYISNLTTEELSARYGERIASRITDSAITKLIPFAGVSLRKSREGGC